MLDLLKKNAGMFRLKRTLPIIAAFGIVVTVLVVKLQPKMVHDVQIKRAVPVNVIEIQSHKIRPAIVGYGSVKPDLTLQAKAEVMGRITFIHPELKKGAMLAKDTLVMIIDDKDYKLALKQAHADLLAAKASLKEMELNIENNKLEMKLANAKLDVRAKELKRLNKLAKSGTVSQSRLDQEKQTMLAQQQEVQKLENLRTTLPSELDVLDAKIDISQAKVEQSERDLARTQVTLPFSGRISDVYVEKDMFVQKGANIFDSVGMNKITINTQFSIDNFARFASEFDKDVVNFSANHELPVMRNVLDKLGLTAYVEIAGSQFKGWHAKVERFSDNLDMQSRTIGVIVSVTGSYNDVEPGVRPPLLEGMYMKVSLQGKSSDYIALPRFALRQQQVFKVSNDNTLQRITLSNVQLQSSLALIKNDNLAGLKPGDQIIVSDVFPAVDGMRLEPLQDEVVMAQIKEWVGDSK